MNGWVMSDSYDMSEDVLILMRRGACTCQFTHNKHLIMVKSYMPQKKHTLFRLKIQVHTHCQSYSNQQLNDRWAGRLMCFVLFCTRLQTNLHNNRGRQHSPQSAMTQQMHHLKCSTFREWPWCCEFSVRTAGWNEQLLQGGAGLGVNVFCLNQAQPFYSRFVIMPAEVKHPD